MIKKKSKKNWQEKFLWVNSDLVVLSYPRTKAYVGHSPMLFGVDKELADALEKVSINGEDWPDCFFATSGMSSAWKAHVKMFAFFFEREGIMLLILLSLAPPPYSAKYFKIGNFVKRCSLCFLSNGRRLSP